MHASTLGLERHMGFGELYVVGLTSLQAQLGLYLGGSLRP